MKRLIASIIALGLVFAPSADATFPGKNGKIAFERATFELAGNLETINPDGSGLTTLLRDRFVTGSWSPDGSMIAFQGYPYRIYTIRADGTGFTQLTIPQPDPTGEPIFDRHPSWSPDGRIAFARQSAANATIYVMNANGSNQTQITSGHDIDPAWSPDGSRIAFMRYRDRAYDLYTVAPDGSQLTRLDGLRADWSPDWSPDSSKLAYAAVDGVHIANADGSGDRFLVPGETPVWSPDGNQIAFRRPYTGLHIVSVDGSGLVQIPGSEQFSFPAWQPIPFKNRAKQCKAEGKRGRALGACVSGR
jgi:Tol biopolymer transport system component